MNRFPIHCDEESEAFLAAIRAEPFKPRPDTVAASKPLDEEPDLSEIHAWQATPEGIIALRMMDLMTAISELEQLAENTNVLPLVAAERFDLELANASLTRLLARVPS